MIINNDEEREMNIIEDAKDVMDNMRIKVEIQIVNNNEQLPINHVIKSQSKDADLIFLGLADVQEGREMEFIERADHLYKDLGTIALVKASSFFKELHIGV
jgi:hypothetical protein